MQIILYSVADSHEREFKQCAHAAMNAVRLRFAAKLAFLVFAIGWRAADAAVCCDSSSVASGDRGDIVASCQNENRTFHTVEAIGDSASCDDDQTAWPVRNCCPPGELYDPEVRICIPDTAVDGDVYRRRMLQLLRDAFPAAAEAAMVGYDHEEPLCDDTQVLVDVPAAEVRVLMKADPSAVELPPGYCFDLTPSDELVVQTCRPRDQYCGRDNYTCINKCCGRGQMIVYDDKENSVSCEKSKTPLTISVYETDSEGRSMGRSKNTVLPYYLQLKCSDITKVDGGFMLTTDGSLHLITTEGLLVMDNDKFCVDYCDDKVGSPVTARLTAIFCSNLFVTFEKWLDFYHYASKFASVVCLALTLLVYATLPYLRNDQGYYVMCYVACELVSYACTIASDWIQNNAEGHTCVLYGYFMLFFNLIVVCWLNVICFDIYWMLRYNNSINRNTSISVRTIMYHIYSWGLPSVCVSTGYLFQHTQHETLRKLSPNIGESSCWINTYFDYGPVIFYTMPVSVMLTVNLILFLLTTIHYLRIKSKLNKFNPTYSNTESFLVYKERFVMSIKLFLIMGIIYLAWLPKMLIKIESIIFYNYSDLITNLQGVFVFIILVVKRKVIMDLWKKIVGEKKNVTRDSSSCRMLTTEIILHDSN